MANEALNLVQLDEVWLVPCNDTKEKEVKASAKQRLDMLKISIKEHQFTGFPVDENEARWENHNVSIYEIIKAFEKTYEKFEFFFMCDCRRLERLFKNEFGEKAREELTFVLFNCGYIKDLKIELPAKYILLNNTFFSINEEEIHKRISIWSKVKELANEKDKIKYITQNLNENFKNGIYLFKLINSIETNKIPGFSNENLLRKSINNIDLYEKYLGLLGIVPKEVIEFIVENKLYKN